MIYFHNFPCRYGTLPSRPCLVCKVRVVQVLVGVKTSVKEMSERRRAFLTSANCTSPPSTSALNQVTTFSAFTSRTPLLCLSHQEHQPESDHETLIHATPQPKTPQRTRTIPCAKQTNNVSDITPDTRKTKDTITLHFQQRISKGRDVRVTEQVKGLAP